MKPRAFWKRCSLQERTIAEIAALVGAISAGLGALLGTAKERWAAAKDKMVAEQKGEDKSWARLESHASILHSRVEELVDKLGEMQSKWWHDLQKWDVERDQLLNAKHTAENKVIILENQIENHKEQIAFLEQRIVNLENEIQILNEQVSEIKVAHHNGDGD